MKRSGELENAAILDAAEMMAVSARTAPKTRGVDNIEVLAIDDDKTRKKIIETMRKISAAEKRPSFERDAGSIKDAPVFMVIGVKSNPAGLNCGYCGYRTCGELKRSKGVCSYNSIDLGIAVSSAAQTAGAYHIDNRIMYSIGRACLDLGLLTKDSKQALGIPLSVTGKNPFFDR